MDVFERPSVAIVATLFFAWVIYVLGLAAYRLYLSPIAHFPGPRLAALSRWYEMYYDVILKGQFTFHIQDLHKKYGPIIRIAPDELHIEDSDYHEVLYSRAARFNKDDFTSGRFGSNSSVSTTADFGHHALRRNVLNPMFSKRSILKFQPVIHEKVQLLCDVMVKYKEKGKEFTISRAWSALAGDIITVYSFGVCYNHLETPDFNGSFHDAYMAASRFGLLAIHIQWIHPIMKKIPVGIVRKLRPGLGQLLQLLQDLTRKLQQIQAGQTLKGEIQSTTYTTIFKELIDSDLPPAEKSTPRLVHEAQTIIGAGVETTSWALSVATYHILANPHIHQTLRSELAAAMPSPSTTPDLLALEKLPYLTACIQEGIRLSYGISFRQPRVNPTAAMQYKNWTIPPATVVSMTIVDVVHDEKVFPNSRSFNPERWLGNPKTENGSSLSRYFVNFGKDARSCLGINLAYAELYISLATVFRRFDFQLFDTDVSDVELRHDFFLPSPKLDSKGVRVKVVGVEQ